MPTQSLKKSLYIFIAAILIQACVMTTDYYFRHRVEVAESTHHAILEMERTFLAILVEESHALVSPADKMALADLYRKLNEMIRHEGLELDNALFEERNQLYAHYANLKQERRSLHQRLNLILPTLTSSVRYIHEHHIAYLKNLLSRGRLNQDYDTGESFKRSPVRSAPELGIIEMAVAIQTSMLDIFETFSKIERGFSPAAIRVEFHGRIQMFYRMVNTLEDYSLDAQDGLLVEELLLNGRTFEDSFNRFLAIEKSIRELSAEKEALQHVLMDQLKIETVNIETACRRFEHRIENLQHASQLVNFLPRSCFKLKS